MEPDMSLAFASEQIKEKRHPNVIRPKTKAFFLRDVPGSNPSISSQSEVRLPITKTVFLSRKTNVVQKITLKGRRLTTSAMDRMMYCFYPARE